MQQELPFGNPLFAAPGLSPSPAQNPVFSPATFGTAPQSAVGMRRLGVLPPSQLQAAAGAAAGASPATSDAAMADEGYIDDEEGGQPPADSLAVASPGAGGAPGSRERPEEDEFASVLGAVMRGEVDSAEAIREYAAICRQRAAGLKELASSQLQRAARYMSLKEQAEELEGEAATWQLLWFLHGLPRRDFPGGSGGGFVDGAGFSKTTRQRASDLLFSDAALNRCARTVAWLEFLAGEALESEHQAPLASSDGVWADTRRRLDAAAASRGFAGRDAVAMVTELDPDAPSRQRKQLQADDAKDEERLMARVFRLLRAGRMREARELCELVGQPWRAASLGGGGGVGPLPLGAAADEADAMDPAGEQAQDLATEVEAGAGLLRALWRWSCFQLAERAGAAAEASGGGLHEAAVYAALSCHVARVLPVCASWEDCCWAYLRCWLDAAVDAALAAQQQQQEDSGALVAAEAAEGLVGADLLAAAAGDAGGAAAATVQDGLAVMRGGWPIARVREVLPPTFEEALQAAISSRQAAAAAGAAAPAATRYRRVQAALVLGQVQELVCRTLVQWITQGGSSSAADGGADGAPACPPGLMRFGAHLALALWALNIAEVAEGDASAAYDQVHDTLQRVLQMYIFHLIDTGAHKLVPLYACHLRAGLRHTTYQIFFEQLLAQGTMEECRAAYRVADEWFSFWRHGDVVPGEAALIADKAAQLSRLETGGGPLLRAQSARWLCFGAAGGTGPAALRHANLLCREFALGATGGVTAASTLLTEVLPAALGTPLEQFLSAMESSGDAAVEADAAELRAWALYFEYESEFAGWQALYMAAASALQAAEAEDPAGAAAEEARARLAALAQQTLPLLGAMLEYLGQRSLDCLVGWAEGGGVAALAAAEGCLPAEVAVVVGPDAGVDTAPEVQQGAAFPTYGSLEEQQEAAAALQAALQAGAATLPAAEQQQLGVGAGPAQEDMPGLVAVVLQCGSPAAIEAATDLLAAAFKGALPLAGSQDDAVAPLVVVNVDAPPAASAALCRAICYPRLALKCAALREAVAFMGHSGGEGEELVELVAAPELSALFSQAELAELLQCERAAAVLQMRNAEQQAAALGGRQQQQQQQQQQQEGEDAGEAGLEPEGRDQQGDEAAGQ